MRHSIRISTQDGSTLSVTRPATNGDFSAVARLHADCIPAGFLSLLGVEFLSELYRSLAEQPGTVVFVAPGERGEILGFIAGTTDTRSLFRRALFKRWHRLIVPALRSSLSFSNLKRAAETVIYGLSEKSSESRRAGAAELLSIAVEPRGRRSGTGGALVLALEQFFRERGVRTYKVVTSADDPSSRAFYGSRSFTAVRTFKHHDNAMIEFVKSL